MLIVVLPCALSIVPSPWNDGAPISVIVPATELSIVPGPFTMAVVPAVPLPESTNSTLFPMRVSVYPARSSVLPNPRRLCTSIVASPASVTLPMK